VGNSFSAAQYPITMWIQVGQIWSIWVKLHAFIFLNSHLDIVHFRSSTLFVCVPGTMWRRGVQRSFALFYGFLLPCLFAFTLYSLSIIFSIWRYFMVSRGYVDLVPQFRSTGNKLDNLVLAWLLWSYLQSLTFYHARHARLWSQLHIVQ